MKNLGSAGTVAIKTNMAIENSYDVKTCDLLKKQFEEAKLFRPMRVKRYDPGTELVYAVTGVAQPIEAQVRLTIEKFVGGGFAGQVYRVKILEIKTGDCKGQPGDRVALRTGNVYAMKILIPPSGFSRFFRNLIYRVGFQGPFQLQVNPAAVRAGALWQKLIRRGAKIRFGDEGVVNDIHATFIDRTLGSCGELSDWVDGRTWRLEVDDRMDLLKRYLRGKAIDRERLGSPEYRDKREFMRDFVRLLHDMGGHEFARQYEWSTCKSQPNCLKQKKSEANPESGLIAVDFRAGLALLPFLPMSPGDFLLIVKGLFRGSLVQFDRGNLKKLEKFMNNHSREFADLMPLLAELQTCEEVYRNSLPDITHNHLRLLYSKKLWSTWFKSTRTGWRVQNIISAQVETRLGRSKILTLLFYLLGIIPIFGSFLRKLFARPDWRKHYGGMLSRWNYLKRALRGKCIEKAISWHRAGRVDSGRAKKIATSFIRYLFHLPLSLLPMGLQRFLTQWSYVKERLYHLLIRPVKLYFSASMREQWLRDMVAQGQKKHILAEEDARKINSQIKEPFIQKYLKSLAVHVCTLPVTQVVSVIVSWIYVVTHPELSSSEAMAAVAAILVLFQITPISPGSLTRGLYVVYLVIKERNFRDYNIALFLSFFKYIGYLAFPIQMTYRYPELARFMAVHWATEAVHIVPVFGESGALLEHWVFRLFYNWPLTIRRRMRGRAEYRAALIPRYRHTGLYVAAAAAILNLSDLVFFNYTGIMPGLRDTWWLALMISFLCGAGITLGGGGAPLSKRFISAALWGVFTGLLYMVVSAFFVFPGLITVGETVTGAAWRIFIFTIFSTIGAIYTELRLPPGHVEPVRKQF